VETRTTRVVMSECLHRVAPLPANDDEFAVMFLFLLRDWHPRGRTLGADKA
jgi:hypothetical protein